MGIRVEVVGANRVTRKARTVRQDVQDSMTTELRSMVREMYVDMVSRAGGSGPMARIGIRSVRVTIAADGAQIKGGGGSDLPSTLFIGSERGGQRRRKTYTGRRGAKFFLVRERATTMQFRPYVGVIGYYFAPAIRSRLIGSEKRLMNAAVRGVQQ